MNRSIIVVLTLVLLFGTQAAFAQRVLPEPVLAGTSEAAVSAASRPGFIPPALNDEISFLWSYGSFESGYVEYTSSLMLAAAGTSDAEIPASIRNNRYFVESVRLTNLAQQSYDEGDYDASAEYSAEAVRYAQLSDEYVRLQLKIKETDDAIAMARKRLDFASSVNASTRFPAEYGRAQTAYTEARNFRAAENWDEAIAAANRVLSALVYVDREPEKVPEKAPERIVEGPPPLPAQYTVRPWALSKDCFWNIAGRPWVYNDPKKWKVLYDANRAGMPEPDNPNLIHPGMVLNIPSVRGEIRQGMWDASKTYSPLNQ